VSIEITIDLFIEPPFNNVIIEDLYFGYRFFSILCLFFVSRNIVVRSSEFYSDYHNNVPNCIKRGFIRNIILTDSIEAGFWRT